MYHPHFLGKTTEVQATQLEPVRARTQSQVCVAPEPPGSFHSSFFLWSICSPGQRTGVWDLCIACMPHAPDLGGKMSLTLVNAMLLTDLGKCLAAPIHLPKGNVIKALIIP